MKNQNAIISLEHADKFYNPREIAVHKFNQFVPKINRLKLETLENKIKICRKQYIKSVNNSEPSDQFGNHPSDLEKKRLGVRLESLIKIRELLKDLEKVNKKSKRLDKDQTNTRKEISYKKFFDDCSMENMMVAIEVLKKI